MEQSLASTRSTQEAGRSPPTDRLSALGEIRITHAPFINRQRRTMATRLVVSPDGNHLPSLTEVWAALADRWLENGPMLSLSIDPFQVDADFFTGASPHASVILEVPANTVIDAKGMAIVLRLHQAGFKLALRGRPAVTLPTQLLSCFVYAVMHYSEDRRIPGDHPDPQTNAERVLPFCLSGVIDMEGLEACFARGAQASVGWPLGDLVVGQGNAKNMQGNFHAIAEAMRLVDKNAPPTDIEATLKSDPTITFRLMRYINSAGFGLLSEVRSIREAVMMLGYQPLKRWLAVMLSNAVKDANRLPVAQASLRRGLFLERLVDRRVDAEMADELFVLGVFSMLDKLMGQPLSELIDQVPVSENVKEALVQRTGQYADYLYFAEVTEQNEYGKLTERLDRNLLTQSTLNVALYDAILLSYKMEMEHSS